MTMTTLRDIVNGDPADANDLEFNFNTIESYIASDVVVRDGTSAFTAAQTGVAGTADTHLATVGQVNAVHPVGSITMYGGTTAPSGWALCQGQSVSSTDPTYAELYAVIGTTFGNPGGGNFNLPDMRNNVPVGKSGTKALGSTGGRSDWELLQHTHTQNAHSHTQNTHNHTMGTHIHSMPTHFHTMPTHSHTVTGTVVSGGSHSHGDGTLTTNGPTTGVVAVGTSYATSAYMIPASAGTSYVLINDGGQSVGGGIAMGAIIKFGTDIGVTGSTASAGSHSHTFSSGVAASIDPGDTHSKDPGDTNPTDPGDTNNTTATNNNTTAVNQNAGTETTTANQNLQPYVTVNFIIKL